MKTCLTELVFLVEEDSDGGYVARALGESICTQGDTLEEVRRNIRDGVRCDFDEAQAPQIWRRRVALL